MPTRFKRLFKLYHILLQRTGGYTFIRQNVSKLIGSVVGIIALFYLIDTFVIDIDSATAWLTKTLSAEGLIAIFFASEISIGLVSPEILIVWADETEFPVWTLALLASISYIGGLSSYFIGRYLATRKIIRERLVLRYASTMRQLKRFGGLLIIIAALTPLPYPIVCQLCGINKFPFRVFALLTLVRFLRFAIYGLVLYKMF
jgi:membrane protein YqaA with SNARE-associated domain